MNKLLRIAACIFLGTSILCVAKGKKDSSPTDTQSLVMSVTMTGSSGGTITITGDDTPFIVDADATIMIDGQRATINDVHAGMQVLSRTAPDSSMAEIDLKTVAAPPPSTKHKKTSDQ